jgi:hypothetical protein
MRDWRELCERSDEHDEAGSVHTKERRKQNPDKKNLPGASKTQTQTKSQTPADDPRFIKVRIPQTKERERERNDAVFI